MNYFDILDIVFLISDTYLTSGSQGLSEDLMKPTNPHAREIHMDTEFCTQFQAPLTSERVQVNHRPEAPRQEDLCSLGQLQQVTTF